MEFQTSITLTFDLADYFEYVVMSYIRVRQRFKTFLYI